MFKVGDRVMLKEYLDGYLKGKIIFREYRITELDNKVFATLDSCFVGSLASIHVDHLYTLREYRAKKLRDICSRLEIE